MFEILKADPWLIIVMMALSIPILGIIFGTVARHMTTVRLAELDSQLKQDMLQRGMSAEDIKTVIEATPRRKGKNCAPDVALHG